MNPGIAANQQRVFLSFLAELRPHVRRDSALPRRIKELLARQRAIGSRDRKLYRELIYTWLRFLPWTDPLLDADPVTAAKIIAWLAPDLKPTTAYRAAFCAGWPPVPGPLAEKAALLEALVPGRASPPDEPSSANLDSTPAARRDDSPYPKPAAYDPQVSLSAIGPAAAEGLRAAAPAARLVPGGQQAATGRFQVSDLLPSWFHEHCPAAFAAPHLDAINSRANVWVRIQCNDRNLVLDEFRARQWSFEVAPDFPDAVRLPPNAEVAGSDAYRRGFIEIQDLGSQLVLATAPIAPGGRWLDACAGAGGKSLQLARLLGDAGQVDATDIRLDILDELRDRAQRARLTNVCITNNPGAAYDGVLVDAPCSGSGTWRRQPHLKWYVKPETIASFTRTQLEILTAQAPRVKPGGLLIYATCSLSHHENQDVVAAFLKNHPAFKPEPAADTHGGTFDGLGTTLLPGTRDTDGFYVATLRRL